MLALTAQGHNLTYEELKLETPTISKSEYIRHNLTYEELKLCQ